MKKMVLILSLASVGLGFSNLAWAQCSNPNDWGECDTFYLECYNPVQYIPPPWEVYVPMLVTHDIADLALDSISCFYIPFGIEHTNSAAYCSIPAWRNHTELASDTANSIFRHFGGMQNRMMSLYEQGNGGEWDFRNLDVHSGENFWFSAVPTGTADQRWWEGSRVLFATMTFLVSDTTAVTIEGEWWPPDQIDEVLFSRMDAVSYAPQQNLPYTFVISYDPKGDANNDGVIDIADPLLILNYLFGPGPPPDPWERGDANCDGYLEFDDAIYLLNYLFRGGPPPGC